MRGRDEGKLRARAERGDTQAMTELAQELTRGAYWGTPDPQRVEEGATWYQRAAEAGDIPAMFSLALLYGRRGEQGEEERWLGAAAEGGDKGAMHHLHRFLQRHKRGEEAAVWYRRLAELGDRAAVRAQARLAALRGDEDEAWDWCERLDDLPSEAATIGRALELDGQHERAEHWMAEAMDMGESGAMLWFADRAERERRFSEAESLYRRAGATWALGPLLERQDRFAEAEEVYREGRQHLMLAELLDKLGRTSEAEDAYLLTDRSSAYADFLERHGRTTEAAEIRQDLAESGAQMRSVPDWVTVVTTVVISSGIVPFIQALINKAAEDSYDGARGMLRKAARKQADKKKAGGGVELAESTLIVVSDPDRRLRLHMRTDLNDEALAALRELSLEEAGAGRRLKWDPESRQWRAS